MIEIELQNLGRRFNTHWIFKNLNATFKANEHLVIKGANGSGKSTLLKIISGVLSPTEGQVLYTINGNTIKSDDIFKHISICTPYLTIPEELTLDELLKFHQQLKPLNNYYSGKEFAELLSINYEFDKPIHLYSSGMKQRVKLALAILSNSAMVLLDEPVSNLDEAGKNWYKTLIQKHSKNRFFLVCSNHIEAEHFFCSKTINIHDYKQDN